MKTLPKPTLSQGATDFIDEVRMNELLSKKQPEPSHVRAVIAKSMEKQALDLSETALLLRAEAPELIEEIFDAARRLKRDVYGNRIVLFAPLYIGSLCINDCLYCAFRKSNPDAVRRTLNDVEIREQTLSLERQGHKRLILVFGEHPRYDAEFIARTVAVVYGTKENHGEIRRLNINAAPLDVEGYRLVREAGIGTYQVFQETYRHATFRKCHPAETRKGDYLYRLDALNRAQEAGIDDVGIGALFGLDDWRFEVLGLVAHAAYMQERFGVGPHTISFPRLRPAQGVSLDSCHLVNDDEFKRLIAILRLAVPYTGLILTAREKPELRREAMSFGVSQIDAGSRIEIGGYTEVGDAQCIEREQFRLGDIRSLDVVMQELIVDGYIPSFCTACYRLGRTGQHFMEYAVPGFIHQYCTPNALTTLMEYLLDYASPETRCAGEALIATELSQIADPKIRAALSARVSRIKETEDRDLYC